MTTTGISAAAVTGATYTATVEYANVSWSTSAVNPSANVALNILANGVIVGTGTLSGLAQNSPWTTVTASWVAQPADAGQPVQLQVVATNFLEGPGSDRDWQVPTFAFANAVLTSTASTIARVAVWKSNTNGVWNSGSNWTNTQGRGPPGFSGVSGDQAGFNGVAGLNVDLGNSRPSIAGVSFGPSALNYDIMSSGSGQLQLNNGSSNATITVSAGSQTIAAPVVLESNVNVTLAGGTSLAISGGIGQSGGSQGLTLSGSGSLTLSGSDGYTGGMTVDGGTLFVDSSSAIATKTGLTVGAGGTVVFGPSGLDANDTTTTSNATLVATSSDTRRVNCRTEFRKRGNTAGCIAAATFASEPGNQQPE